MRHISGVAARRRLWPQSEHDMEVIANKILAIPYLTSGFVAPLMGGVIDRVGHRCVVAARMPRCERLTKCRGQGRH